MVEGSVMAVPLLTVVSAEAEAVVVVVGIAVSSKEKVQDLDMKIEIQNDRGIEWTGCRFLQIHTADFALLPCYFVLSCYRSKHRCKPNMWHVAAGFVYTRR